LSNHKKSRCSSCCWGEQCNTDGKCDNYTPLVADIDNEEYIAECEERRRNEFFEDWEEYANQFSD